MLEKFHAYTEIISGKSLHSLRPGVWKRLHAKAKECKEIVNRISKRIWYASRSLCSGMQKNCTQRRKKR